MDCGAFQVLTESDSPLLVDTDEWADAWQNDPERLAGTLTPA